MADKTTQELEQILALLNSMRTTIDSTRRSIEGAPQGFASWRAEAERLIAMQREYNVLLEREKSLRGSGGKRNYVATPAGEAPSPTVTPTGGDAGLTYKTKSQRAEERALLSLEKKRIAEEKRAKIAEQAAIEEKRIADARSKIINDPRYRQALQNVGRAGLGSENLQSIEDRLGGVQKLSFGKQQGGVNLKSSQYVTEGGKSTPGLSSQFRSFGSDILRDIGQFTKWSIAVAAVYTPLKKLGELITVMVDNESRLADATIAANVPFEKAGELFDTVAVSANQAGESINTTIDAYAQAIRAAGRYNTEQEKTQKGLALLNDSLILSKLSTLDQATAIDTLSAALLQSDRELDQGQELLNKWVKISQIANVSIDGLATGVAVLGDSAETVGLSIDQLNGLIAVLSEQSISGSKEAANTAKALVGAYQSDKAEAALNKYGIALRKASGEVRDFFEIYQELSTLRQQGVLSESAVSEIALALGGGGVRRAKDASALINSTERLNDLAKESAKVTGEDSLANDSLAKKLETVETANTRLSNSFQELAQTLGDDGGLLDSFKGIINGLTAITKGANELFTLLGRSGPILATFATGLLAIRAIPTGVKDTQLARLGAGQGGFQGFLGGQAQYGARSQPGGVRGLAANVLQQNLQGGLAAGGAAVGISAISNLAAGNNKQALANIGGGIAGAIIGTLIAPGAGTAVGAIIGSSAAESMTNAILNYAPVWEDFFAETFQPTQPEKPAEAVPETPDERRERIAGEVAKTSDISELAARYMAGFLNAVPDKLVEKFVEGNAANLVPEELRGVDYEYTGEKFTARQIQLANAPKEEQDRVANERRLQEALQLAQSPKVPAQYEALRKQLEAQATQARQQQLGRLASGDITTAQYGKITSQISGFPAASIKSITAFGDEIVSLSKDIDSTKEAYDAFLYLSEYGTQEQINLINQFSDDTLQLQALVDNWNPDAIGLVLELSMGDVSFKTKEEAIKYLNDIAKQGAKAFDITLGQVQTQQAQAIKLPPLVGDYAKAPSRSDYQLNVEEGSRIQQQFYQESGKTPEEIDKLVAAIETWYTAVDDGARTVFQSTDGLEQRFYELGKSANEAAGKLDEIQKGIGFQKFDVSMSQLEQLAKQSLQIGTSWSTPKEEGGLGFNYDFKPEDQIAIDNQGIVQPLHADFKILALLLEKLNEKAQKQLDGQYNIPEGATFWVPLTAAYYRNKGGDGGGLGDALNSLDLGENTTSTDRNTQAVDRLTERFMMKNDPEGYKQGYKDKNQVDDSTKPFRGVPKEFYQQKNEEIVRSQTGRGTNRAEEPTSIIESLRQAVINLVKNSQGLPNPAGNANLRDATRGVGTGSPSSITNRTQTTSAPTTTSAKLDLKISSNINLMVDGRILASTLQNYLASELLQTEQTQGTLSKRYII